MLCRYILAILSGVWALAPARADRSAPSASNLPSPMPIHNGPTVTASPTPSADPESGTSSIMSVHPSSASSTYSALPSSVDTPDASLFNGMRHPAGIWL